LILRDRAVRPERHYPDFPNLPALNSIGFGRPTMSRFGIVNLFVFA